MKNERRSTQELNRLSAYLDGALTASEQKQLEAALMHDQNLREKLENLRRTKIILGSLPRMRAPHNFTLSPDMVTVRRKKQQPFVNLLRLASSLAAVLLVVLVGVELVLGGKFQMPGAMMAEAPLTEEVAVSDAETSPEPLIQWFQGGVGGGGKEAVTGMGGGAIMEESASEIYIEEAPVEEMPVEEMPVEEMPVEEMPVEEMPVEEMPEEVLPEEALPEEEMEEAAEAEMMPQINAEPQEQADSSAAQVDGLILGVNPDQGGEVLSRSEPGAEDEPAQAAWPLIRWVQIILAVITIAGGLILWNLKRKQRSHKRA